MSQNKSDILSLTHRFSEIKKQIYEDDTQIVCMHYHKVKNDLMNLIDDANREAVIVNEKLQQYGCSRYDYNAELSVPEKTIDYNERYNKNASWSQKVEYVLRKCNKIMTFTEITDAIVSHEVTVSMGKMEKQKLRDRVRTSLGETLNKNSADRKRTPARFQKLGNDDKSNINSYWIAGEPIPKD